MAATTPLWTAAAAAAATGGVATGEWAATGVSIDTRTLEAGDLFVALRGPNFDGHKFVGDALGRNAAAAMVDNVPALEVEGPAWLQVGDTFEALNALGRVGRQRSDAVIIAITGSVGKTSLKAAVAQILSHQAETSWSRGSFNNHIGAPLSLARLPTHARYGVFELGMNHAGELRALTALVRPHVAVINNVEAAHLEFFNSVDEIADAKAEIFDGLMPGGIAVLNRDNQYFDRLSDAARDAGVAHMLTFGRTRDADVHAIDVEVSEAGSKVRADVSGTPVIFTLAEPGEHWIMNALAALATVQAAGGDIEAAADALAEVTPVAGRGRRQIIDAGNLAFELIDDSYNASPAAMHAALMSLRNSSPRGAGRRIAVLGDMLELGTSSPALHAELATQLTEIADKVFASGPMMRHLDDVLSDEIRGGWTETAEQLAPLVRQAIHDGDVVLVKGSAGSRMGLVVDALRMISAPLLPVAGEG